MKIFLKILARLGIYSAPHITGVECRAPAFPGADAASSPLWTFRA